MKNVVVGVETFADDRITKSTDLHSDEADNKTDSTPAIVQPRLVVVVGRHECQQLREALAGSAFLDGRGQRPIVSSYGPTTVSISINGRAKADPERLKNILAAFPEAKLVYAFEGEPSMLPTEKVPSPPPPLLRQSSKRLV
jgi:hypothetical protein